MKGTMKPDLLSAEDCSKILQNCFARADIKFISFELKPISEDVEGFLGEHYNLSITYELDKKTDTQVFFMKTKPTATAMQMELCEETNVYKKEIFIYDTLIKEFNKYGYDTSFIAKCYYTIPDKSLILENLVHNGFVMSERQTFFDLNKIKCSLEALALYHAAGFAYQETKTKELGKFELEKEYSEYLNEAIYVFHINPNHISMKWWKGCFKTANKIIDLLPEDESYKTQFKNMFNSFSFGKVFVEKTKFAKTCGHGDLWSNNMLFKEENGAAVECRLLDFQLCRYFYPCFDVLLAIFGNTSADFRKAHLEELYQYYYKTLGDTLNNYGYSIQDILPLKEFYESMRLTKADALLQVLCSLFLLYLPTELLTNLVKENDGEGFKDYLNDNSAVCCDVFTKDTRYHKIISDCLQDMRSVLLALQ